MGSSLIPLQKKSWDRESSKCLKAVLIASSESIIVVVMKKLFKFRNKWKSVGAIPGKYDA